MAKPKLPESAQRLQQALAAAGLEGAQSQPADASGVSLAHGSVWQKVSVTDVADLPALRFLRGSCARSGGALLPARGSLGRKFIFLAI